MKKPQCRAGRGALPSELVTWGKKTSQGVLVWCDARFDIYSYHGIITLCNYNHTVQFLSGCMLRKDMKDEVKMALFINRELDEENLIFL